MIAIGGTNIVKAYLGSTELANIAIGDELLLSSEPLPYLKFTALEDATFKFGQVQEYSLDGGGTWTSLAANTASPIIHTGESILWRGNYAVANVNTNKFTATGRFYAMGDPRSIYAGENFIGNSVAAYAFTYLFYQCTYLVDASGILLPATTLGRNCYNRMFQGCSGLTAAPILPATTLAQYCYYAMFNGCTSLTTAPELPATTLADSCYRNMFNGCTSLNYIKAMFTTDPTTVTNSLTNWVNNVAASGTFVKNSLATWDITGNSGVPAGWTIETASE